MSLQSRNYTLLCHYKVETISFYDTAVTFVKFFPSNFSKIPSFLSFSFLHLFSSLPASLSLSPLAHPTPPTLSLCLRGHRHLGRWASSSTSASPAGPPATPPSSSPLLTLPAVAPRYEGTRRNHVGTDTCVPTRHHGDRPPPLKLARLRHGRGWPLRRPHHHRRRRLPRHPAAHLSHAATMGELAQVCHQLASASPSLSILTPPRATVASLDHDGLLTARGG